MTSTLRRSLAELIPGADTCLSENYSRYFNLTCGVNDWKERLFRSQKGSVGFAAPGGEFTRSVFSYFESYQGPLSLGAANDTVILELGAGMSAYGYLLACRLGAAGYVGVEAFYADCLLTSITGAAGQTGGARRIPYCIMPEDMLGALCRVPDRCVSIFAFGIEDCILGSESYRVKVEREVKRVLSPGGFYLSLRSDLSLDVGTARLFAIRRRRTLETANLIICDGL